MFYIYRAHTIRYQLCDRRVFIFASRKLMAIRVSRFLFHLFLHDTKWYQLQNHQLINPPLIHHPRPLINACPNLSRRWRFDYKKVSFLLLFLQFLFLRSTATNFQLGVCGFSIRRKNKRSSAVCLQVWISPEFSLKITSTSLETCSWSYIDL